MWLTLCVCVFLCRDESAANEQDAIKGNADQLPTRRVMFIRHGESEWNLCFNRGFGPSMLVRIAASLLKEWRLSFMPDSVFLDSPLSDLGCQQAKQLLAFVESYPKASEENAMGNNGANFDPAVSECVSILRGEKEASTTVLWTSNLKRSIATVIIGLWARLNRATSGGGGGNEKVAIHSFLQEISTNVDCVALADPLEVPELDLSAPLGDKNGGAVSRYLDPRGNRGNKPVFGKGLTRLQRFSAAAFRTDCTTIVASGHSLWFKYYFQVRTPPKNVHILPALGTLRLSNTYTKRSHDARRVGLDRKRKVNYIITITERRRDGT